MWPARTLAVYGAEVRSGIHSQHFNIEPLGTNKSSILEVVIERSWLADPQAFDLIMY